MQKISPLAVKVAKSQRLFSFFEPSSKKWHEDEITVILVHSSNLFLYVSTSELFVPIIILILPIVLYLDAFSNNLQIILSKNVLTFHCVNKLF